MNKLSLWSKVITETETSKMNKNNEIMKKEIDECIKFKKQQVEIIEKKKKEEQEQKKKEEQEKKLKYEKAKNEQEKLEKEKALKLKQENEIKIKEQEEKIKKEAQKNKAPVNDSLTSIKSSSAVEEAQLYLNEIKKIKNEIRPAVKENKEWKNQTLKLKLRINTRVIQISSTKESVNEISTDLNNILNQGKQISTEVYYWLMDFLAKAIMKQAENEIGINKVMAFPVAHVINNIVNNHEPFFKIFIGRLYKKCIYLVPRYINKTKDKTDIEYLKEIGYKKSGKGMENESRYYNRIEGMVSLFSAIIQTPSTNENSKLNMASGWTWLARLLNMPPRKITLFVLITFLEIAGYEMLNVYGKQMNKILNFILNTYIPMAPKESVSFVTRLKLFIEKYKNDGNRLNIPEGKNFT
jgi:nucleoporin GLE1